MDHICVIVTGDRNAQWNEWGRTVGDVLRGDKYKGTTAVLIHGDARGIDRIAERKAGGYGWRTLPVPAQWKAYGPAAGPKRNQTMLDISWHLEQCGYRAEVLAFHDSFEGSKGTKNMVSLAIGAGVPVTLYTSSGDSRRITVEDIA